MSNPTPISFGPSTSGNGGGSSNPNPPAGNGGDPPSNQGAAVDWPLIVLWGAVVISLIGLCAGYLFPSILVFMVAALAGIVLLVGAVVAFTLVVGSGVASKAGELSSEGAKLKFPTGAFVKSVLGKFISLRPADQVWVYLNELTADKASSKGWYTQGLDGNYLGRLAIGFPFLRVPYAAIDLSSEQFTWTVACNPGGEAYEVEVVVEAQVAQENGTVALETARRLLTEIDKDPAKLLEDRFGADYQQALKTAGVSGSTDHSAKFADIDEAALERANETLAKYGLVVTDVRTQKVKPGAAAETASETKTVLDAVTAGVPDNQKGLVAVGTMLIQKLPEIAKAFAGKGGGGEARPAPEPKEEDKSKKKGKR